MEILEQIKPKITKDFVGCRPQINKLQELLNDTTKPFIGIVGPEGCGKTTLVSLLLNPSNFSILNLNKDFSSNKELVNVIVSFCDNMTIESFFNKKRKCVLVDGFETLIQTDKLLLSSLMTCLEIIKKNNALLVIVANSSEEKRLIDTKQEVEIVKMTYPQQRDCFAYLMNKDIGIDDEVLLALVKEHKCNIRDIILNMHSKFVKDCVEYRDMSNFEIIKHIYNNGCRLDNVEEQFKEDSSLVSFMFYENVPEHICLNLDTSVDQKLKLYGLMNNNFVMSCLFENYVYESGNYNFYDLINMVRLYGSVTIIMDVPKKKTITDYKMRFSQILSKVSHKNIMSKKVKSIMMSTNMSYHNIYLMADAVSTKVVKYRGTTDEANFISTYHKYFAS